MSVLEGPQSNVSYQCKGGEAKTSIRLLADTCLLIGACQYICSGKTLVSDVCVTLQVACGGYHTLAVCAHDSMQQEQAEKQRGYKQKVMQLFSKPVTVDVPDSRQHSSGPNTAGSGGITPLDRVSDGSMSLMAHGSNGTLTAWV